jgi:hypothetical protein
MSVTIPPGYAQLALQWQIIGGSKIFVSTLGFLPAAGEIDPQAMANAMDVLWLTRFGPAQTSNQYNRLPTIVRYRPAGGGDVQIAQSGVTSPGTAVWSPPPPNTVLLVTKVTALGGRKNRGRMYLPPCFITESEINQLGIINAGWLTSLQTLLTGFRADVVASSRSLQLLHSGVEAPTAITALTHNNMVATQRRRLRG